MLRFRIILRSIPIFTHYHLRVYLKHPPAIDKPNRASALTSHRFCNAMDTCISFFSLLFLLWTPSATRALLFEEPVGPFERGFTSISPLMGSLGYYHWLNGVHQGKDGGLMCGKNMKSNDCTGDVYSNHACNTCRTYSSKAKMHMSATCIGCD